jgi:hypothetical protein
VHGGIFGMNDAEKSETNILCPNTSFNATIVEIIKQSK